MIVFFNRRYSSWKEFFEDTWESDFHSCGWQPCVPSIAAFCGRCGGKLSETLRLHLRLRELVADLSRISIFNWRRREYLKSQLAETIHQLQVSIANTW